MKINWGTGIVLAFVAFMAFILYFVVIATTDEKASHDLVTEFYYEQELDYQNEINATSNAMALKEKIVLTPSPDGLYLQFPHSWEQKAIKGSIQFYRPSNKNLDFNIPIRLGDLSMLVPSPRLPEGRWDIRIRWEADGKEFLQKERITYVNQLVHTPKNAKK